MSVRDDTPKPAATVILVRDAPDLRVLMVRRNAAIAFGADAWVFPGGKVSAADAPGGEITSEAAFRMAAARETFEEAGLLLARRADGRFATAADCEALAQWRPRVEADPSLFPGLLLEAELTPALDRLVPFAHWITPAFEPRRFDTRFFLAAAPPEQAAAHDGREAVEHDWVSPAGMLQRRREGQARLMFPTRLNIEVLAGCVTASEAEAVALARPAVAVEPEVVERDGGRWLRIPREAGYSVVEEAMENVMK
jgi:8-oxo-dGTP pyrophosphatase MutT (NUDIX family)